MEEQFDVEQSFLDETSRLYKLLLKRTLIICGFYLVTYLSTFFTRYKDFDVVFTSNLFRVIFVLSFIPTIINLGLYFYRYQFHKESFFKFVKREREIYDIVSIVPIFISVLVVLNTFVISTASVEGSSMEPNYSEGNTILITHTNNYNRYDVVIVKVEKLTGDEYFIKRVIGLPGDTVIISNNSIMVNGIELDDDEYLPSGTVTTCSTGPNGSVSDECSWVVGDGEYFVLGDNRMYSNDSRSSIVGLIEDENMYGKVIFKVNLFN